MSGLNYTKLGSTLSNICNTTQLDDTTKCHYAFISGENPALEIYSCKKYCEKSRNCL